MSAEAFSVSSGSNTCYRNGSCWFWTIWMSILVLALMLGRFLGIVDGSGQFGVAIVTLAYGTTILRHRWTISHSILLDQENPEEHPQEPMQRQEIATERIHFLDNVKVFLTFLVVTHHSTCAFGCCGEGWLLIIGLYPNLFQSLGSILVILDQAYFMCLFFFVSAFFVPVSYDKKGPAKFLLDKAKRLLIPTMAITFLLIPLCIVMSILATNRSWSDCKYMVAVGHGWFLLWLLLFNFAYSHMRETTVAVAARYEQQSLPSTLPRVLVGVVSGLAMFGVVVFLWPNGIFWGMPITIGSLVNDVLFFSMGVVARRQGWLDATRSIREQLDKPVWMLWLTVLLEILVLLGACGSANLATVLYIVSGVFCIDVSVAILECFQTHFCSVTKVGRFLSDAAFTVYIIHPVVVVGWTWVFVYTYQHVLNLGEIDFDDGSIYSKQPLRGGALTLFLGWLCVNMLSQLVVWPLAWAIRQLPGFKQVL